MPRPFSKLRRFPAPLSASRTADTPRHAGAPPNAAPLRISSRAPASGTPLAVPTPRIVASGAGHRGTHAHPKGAAMGKTRMRMLVSVVIVVVLAVVVHQGQAVVTAFHASDPGLR